MHSARTSGNSVKKTSSEAHQRLVNAFRKNPGDPRNLTRLVQSMNQAGMYARATNLLKKIITNPASPARTKSFLVTAIKCAKKTYFNLANQELKRNRPQQALRVYAELVTMLDKSDNSGRRSDPELAKISSNATNVERLQIRTCQYLLANLLRHNEMPKAVNLLGRKDCIVSYPLAVHIMRIFASSNINRNISNINKHIKLLDGLLSTLGKRENKQAIISNSIYSNAHYPMSPWREKILSRYELSELQKWINVSGMDILKQHLDQGKGIILVSSHMSTGRALNLLLDHMGFRITALEVRDRMAKFGIRSSGNMRVLELGEKVEFPLRELYLIQKSLKKGEIVNLSGDGYRGSSGITVNFLGRKREFKTSFAELAVKTDSIALPVFGSANPSGKIFLQIKPPLTVGNNKMTRTERVEKMVRQYASLLEEVWRKKPGDIAWEQIRYYFSLPAINETGKPSGTTSDGI